jgi:subtilase family serine protease
VWLAGTVERMSAAFGVSLAEYDHPRGGTFRGRTGAILIPPELDGIVVGVFGLDSRPQARPHFRIRPTRAALSDRAADLNTQFTPLQIAQLYNFPANLDGTGERIGIIELGGGFNTFDDAATGSAVRVDGQETVIGATSAVAPLWSGLIARLNQGLGKSVGLLNPTLYGVPAGSGAFRDITIGNNGAYSAGPGWDGCSGLGVADGTKLLQALG